MQKEDEMLENLSVEQSLIRANSHAKKGEVIEAQKLYQAVLQAFPNNTRAHQGLANIKNATQNNISNIPPQETINQIIYLYNQGQFSTVVNQAKTLAEKYPKSFIIWNILGASTAQIGMIDKSIESYKKAISIKPDYIEAYINMGLAYQHLGKLEEAIEEFKKALLVKPDYTEAYSNMGNAFLEQGKLEEAIDAYKTVLSLEPDYAEAFNNMGNALQGQDKLEEAIEVYNKALFIKPDYPEAYSNMGNALQAQGKLEEAIEAYNKALSLKPNYTKAYINMGAAFQGRGKLEEAIKAYKKALLLKSDSVEAYINLSIALHGQGKLQEAMEACNKSISIDPYYAEAYNYMGKILKDQGDISTAIDNFKQALKIRPNYEFARVNKLFNQACICDWTGIEEDRKLIPTIGISDQHIIPGMMTTFEDAPERQKIRAELYAKNTIKQKTILMPPIPIQKPKRLRVGYFSSDFRQHAVMYVMADIFDAHDRDQFEIYGYSFGPNDNSNLRKRITNSFDVFHDVREMSYQDIALLARQDKIDIAIDINGYTKLCRPNIFAYRAAPIQIHFWGSGNTSGANFIDYVIVPDMGVPEEYKHHWSEPIIRLPFWCQARYKDNYISERHITRKDMGLPEQGFVFCSFNNNYKLSPVEFDIWMRLLKKVENSVLWIYKSNKWVEKNLQKEALKRGVDTGRLVFAEKVPHPDHLARQKLADILVDTFNSNAGVTAGDALWVGLPLVTKLGKGYSARAGGYMLASIELPELITKTEQEYEALLLDLATNPKRLSAIKEKLATNRLTTPLFNPNHFTKHLENGYQQAYQRYFDRKDPEAISVPVIPS